MTLKLGDGVGNRKLTLGFRIYKNKIVVLIKTFCAAHPEIGKSVLAKVGDWKKSPFFKREFDTHVFLFSADRVFSKKYLIEKSHLFLHRLCSI